MRTKPFLLINFGMLFFAFSSVDAAKKYNAQDALEYLCSLADEKPRACGKHGAKHSELDLHKGGFREATAHTTAEEAHVKAILLEVLSLVKPVIAKRYTLEQVAAELIKVFSDDEDDNLCIEACKESDTCRSPKGQREALNFAKNYKKHHQWGQELICQRYAIDVASKDQEDWLYKDLQKKINELATCLIASLLQEQESVLAALGDEL